MSEDLIKLFATESDQKNLSLARVESEPEPTAVDYHRLVVNKPWGYEYLMFENSRVAIWILYLKKNYTTSMHCHPMKKTSLIVLDGSVTCSTLQGWHDRKVLQGLIIDRGVFHSTEAISKNGAFIMEIESPPVKHDLVRLKDKYGRAGAAYEGKDKLSRNLKKYDYVDFHNFKKEKNIRKKFKSINFSIMSSDMLLTNKEKIIKDTSFLLALIDGKILQNQDNKILDIGEVIKSKNIFRNIDKLDLANRFFLGIGKE